jgi:hypothetical protein
VEAKVRYVKRNALQGRDEELTCWEDYQRLAVYWRDQVANVRLHESTHERPVDRFEKERGLLRPLPRAPFDTDEILSVLVNSHARVKFDGNRYSTPPELVGQTVMLRANSTHLRIIHRAQEVACHTRCYDRRQLIRDPKHYLEALQRRRRARANQVEKSFNALGEEAQRFHLALRRQPVKTPVHLRRVLNLVRLYGRQEVVAAIARANQYQTYDAAYVQTILLQERRRRELPSPTQVRPRRKELIDEIDLEEPDPGVYDRFCHQEERDNHHQQQIDIQENQDE